MTAAMTEAEAEAAAAEKAEAEARDAAEDAMLRRSYPFFLAELY